MRWLDRLLGRDSFDPECFAAERCDLCGGTGVLTESAAVADPRYNDLRPRVRTCGRCGGRGYVLRKKPE